MAAEPADVRTGSVEFHATADEPRLAEMFRLEPHSFAYREEFQPSSSDRITVSLVTFPSPLATPHECNNTVHCEFFCPAGGEKHPAVVVLHILGGDFPLARLFASTLAHRGVAALFVKMPYYGPRRDPDSPARMVSEDLDETVRGMQQAVLDVRHAAAWLAADERVDPEQLGIFGISLGGITAALAATAEPRIQHVCLMLAGGDVGRVLWETRELEQVRSRWLAGSATRDSVFNKLRSVDPVTYADQIRGRTIFMLNARYDEVIPPVCSESLWQAFGQPKIEWLDCGHYSAALYMFHGLAQVSRFFQSPQQFCASRD